MIAVKTARSLATAGLLGALLAAVAGAGCQTTGPDGAPQAETRPKEPPPRITDATPLDQALTAAIEYGGDTLADVKRVVKRRQELPQAARILEKALLADEGIKKYEHHQLINAVHLYMVTPVPLTEAMFTAMLRSGRPLAGQLGWQLAAAKPSQQVAQAVERELTRAIAEGDEESVLVPQMANAIASNRLKGSYTFARRGLMVKGAEEFAQAMSVLDPRQASEDFLAYLAQAPAEELRQLTMSSVDMYSCIAILKHLQQTPPNVANAHFEHLFFYSVSRNTGLAELAQAVLETYVPLQTEILAQTLARQPSWVQIAYLESARRRMNPRVGLLLGELKKASGEQDVVNEINDIKF